MVGSAAGCLHRAGLAGRIGQVLARPFLGNFYIMFIFLGYFNSIFHDFMAASEPNIDTIMPMAPRTHLEYPLHTKGWWGARLITSIARAARVASARSSQVNFQGIFRKTSIFVISKVHFQGFCR